MPGEPPENIWLGTTVENQEQAIRIPQLLDIPAKVRFLSCEPLLGPLAIGDWLSAISWVICGGESGPGARPMHPAWARGLRDQCQAANVPFFFKQWGDWLAVGLSESRGTPPLNRVSDLVWQRVGKKAAGRAFDGREWNEFPR